MDHLAQDLSVALEESESCGPITFAHETPGKWGMRRRTRSAGNLLVYMNNSPDNQAEDSSSSNSETRTEKTSSSFEWRLKHALQSYIRYSRRCKLGVNHSLESDSVNENSPARPNLRRKRKLKRMSIDEAPVPPCGKRKRPQRFDIVENGRSLRHPTRIRPLHQTVVDKIEKMFQNSSNLDDTNTMETQSIDDCDFTSESSISWSGGEGHDGDDELTDWAPTMDNPSSMEQPFNEADPREIRAGCRRLGDERPGFSISTGANERVAKFLQDTTKSELRVLGGEREKLGQLAALYSLDLWFESPTSSLLRKTNKTPCMQPPQKHHSGMSAGHKRIRTHGRFVGVE
ncbi:uncharacterized protein LOC658351 [Tribolium castaneum]|uniref:Uncharacterized protein n=1 Tax=Tribolium castaneum TaxID=7070 RepID=D1ZZB4_TRICA|nr:PREDICTED: uncharacterized protein LOC658351 [Tribolium castaneum]EFA01875.1 hypothetical protein TcasGA2_TC007480 [Tribolium castaneum]|eukprot:XP_969841.1 PREDICTED: uncharacterized protein LOC658351 [Tribolium castaneum]